VIGNGSFASKVTSDPVKFVDERVDPGQLSSRSVHYMVHPATTVSLKISFFVTTCGAALKS